MNFEVASWNSENYVAKLGSGLVIVVRPSSTQYRYWFVELIWAQHVNPWYPEGFGNYFGTAKEAMEAAQEHLPTYIRKLVDCGLEALKECESG